MRISPETVVMATILFAFIVAIRPIRFKGRRHNHSWRYRWYIDNNSWLWRLRRWEWYWTRGRRCAKCGVRVCLHGKGMRWQLGASVAQFHHLNYRHLCFERYGRDIQMLCGGCHYRRHHH